MEERREDRTSIYMTDHGRLELPPELEATFRANPVPGSSGLAFQGLSSTDDVLGGQRKRWNTATEAVC